eukprot:9501335-Pyramimonas_sp.AAC.2
MHSGFVVFQLNTSSILSKVVSVGHASKFKMSNVTFRGLLIVSSMPTSSVKYNPPSSSNFIFAETSSTEGAAPIDANFSSTRSA